MKVDIILSYIVSILLCLVIFLVLPRLPSIGFSSKDSLFTLGWLLLAILALAAHLRIVLRGQVTEKNRRKKKRSPTV